MFGKQSKAKKTQAEKSTQTILQESYEEAALGFETSRIEIVEKSEHRAWLVAKVSIGCFALSVIGLVALLPLKESVPYVIRVDQATGNIDMLTSVRGASVSFDDVQDKYFLARYVQHRESYDWHTIQNDYIATKELSSVPVFNEYARLYKGKESLDSIFSNKKRVVTKVISVSPKGNGIADVRLSKAVIDAKSNAVLSRTFWTAQIGYEYNPALLTSESKRLINPFGFKVNSYRLDAEVSNLAVDSDTLE